MMVMTAWGLMELEERMVEFLDEDNDNRRYHQEGNINQPFRITNLDQANWAVRKIARIETARQECRALVEQEMAKLNTWLKSEEEDYDQERSFFEHLLREYMDEQRQQDSKLKTIKLPNGKIGLRKQQPEFQRDNDKLLAWLKKNRQDLVKVKEEPDWAGLKAVAAVLGNTMADPETGEVIEGVTVVHRPDKLHVEFV